MSHSHTQQPPKVLLEVKNNLINEAVLKELEPHLVQPLTPNGKITLAAVFLGVGMLLIHSGRTLHFVAFGLIMSGVMLFVPKLNGSRTVRSMVSNMKKSYGVPFCAYDLSLEENAVKSINCRNHVTGRIPFVSIAKVVETRSVLALFTNHQHLVAFDRAKLTQETRAQILQAIEAGNPSVEKHLLKKK